MATINRVPQSLLPLLDAKTLGQTPSEIETRVSLGIDLREMYAADKQLISAFTSASLTSANLGTLSCIVEVPAGELWYVYGVSGQLVCGATTGSDYDMRVAFQAKGVVSAHFLNGRGTESNFSISTGEQIIDAVTFATPWLVGSGSAFGVVPTKAYSGAAVTTCSVLHRKFSV